MELLDCSVVLLQLPVLLLHVSNEVDHLLLLCYDLIIYLDLILRSDGYFKVECIKEVFYSLDVVPIDVV
jgi:hypothetical protein